MQNFKFTNNPIKKDNPELLLIPEFERLTERQLRYIFLVDWYKSPLRLMELEARKHRAAIMSGYKLEKDGTRLDINGRNLVQGKVATIEAARKVLYELQYDEEGAVLEALTAQIKEIVEFFKKKDKKAVELEKAVKMAKELPTLMETRKKLIEIVGYRQPFESSLVSEQEETTQSSPSLLEDILDELED